MRIHWKWRLIFLLALTAFLYTGFFTENKRELPVHDHSDEYHDHSKRESVMMPENLLLPSHAPDRVILNVTENPETSLAVNWRTDTTVSIGEIQWALATPGPEFISAIQKINAKKEYLNVRYGDEPAVSAHYFSATLNNLKPGKKYIYRVGSEGWYSEWHQVRMPDSSKKLSFIYFGDAQNDIKSMWSRVIREAYKTMPDVDFMLHAGDLINRHNHDSEWGEWFYAGNFIHATIPGIMTPGNHEYGKGVVLSPQWKKQFNLPANGPSGLDETCYVVNYPNLKVISLDAEQIDESPVFRKKQQQWLDSILTNDPRKWTAVTLHYPVFSTSPSRDNEELRNILKPVFDKHKVDIVLQGHDHAYGRGMVSNMPSGTSAKSETGTMYVVSVSGPKMYDLADREWMQRKARNTQLFQIITIEDNTLKYTAYGADGDLYDAFDLIKSAKKPNKLIERVPSTPERK